jgi:hypothetical protein
LVGEGGRLSQCRVLNLKPPALCGRDFVNDWFLTCDHRQLGLERRLVFIAAEGGALSMNRSD